MILIFFFYSLSGCPRAKGKKISSPEEDIANSQSKALEKCKREIALTQFYKEASRDTTEEVIKVSKENTASKCIDEASEPLRNGSLFSVQDISRDVKKELDTGSLYILVRTSSL